MNSISKFWGAEPVAIIGVVDAVLILGITFGVHIAPEQVTAIDGVLAALGVLLARSQVSSPATVAAITAPQIAPKTIQTNISPPAPGA